jgi:phosphoribosylanthranilate isomerase
MRSHPFIKICCIMSVQEARMALEAGASALGLVSQMPSGPGVISDTLIAEIAALVPPPVATFLLTSRQDAASIIAQHRLRRTSTIQLVDHVPFDELRRLREGLPGIRLVQVIHVKGLESIDEALQVAPVVDAILLDSGNSQLPVKELGGTGRTHDWRISRQIRDALAVHGKTLWLAGGLRASNVREAIDAVQPHGLDICSGVRSEGRLDALKLAAFMQAAMT